MQYEDFFSERLMRLREAKNVSAREMSLALGQNASYINRIENKKCFPSMQVFFYICEYLEITPKDFFNGCTENPHEFDNILQLLYTLSPIQLNLIYNIANEFAQK